MVKVPAYYPVRRHFFLSVSLVSFLHKKPERESCVSPKNSIFTKGLAKMLFIVYNQ